MRTAKSPGLVGADLRRLMKQPLTSLLARVEASLLERAPVLSHPPLFVLGVPRSGTTLLYQLLVHCFRVSYFCNAADEHSRYAATVTGVLRSRIRHYRSDFRSDYGRTNGPAGPSEGLDIWARWLPDSYVDERHLSNEAAHTLARTVQAVAAIIGAPFVNKDPHHCVRVRALHALFPQCVFVYIHRDPLRTAESILNIRRKRALSGTDVNTWNSVRPREYALVGALDYLTQICGQVHYCAENALGDLRAVAPARHVVVSYEELCARPERALSGITDFLRAHGVSLRRRARPPTSFDPPNPLPVSKAERSALKSGLAELADGPPVSGRGES